MDRLIPQNDVLALVHSDEYAAWVFDPAHPTQGRRFLKAAELLRELAPEHSVEITEIEADYFPTFEQLQYAHTLEHIERTLLDGESGEWAGTRRDLGTTALRMAGGTILAVEALHAMPGHSSGFCVFNDFAIAARHVLRSQRRIFCPATKSMRRVGRIAILDIDAHHGDGTEAIMRDSQRVLTFSVHDSSIFPGTGRDDEPEFHVFNRPLPAGSDDEGLFDAVDDFVLFADRFSPDMIFIAMGADGHETDPLSSLTYTIEGMVKAVRNVRRAYPEVPILLGGAGGYQPDDVTPEVWARMALAAATPVPADDRYYVGAIGDIGYLDDPEDRLLEPIDGHLAHHAHLFAAAQDLRAAHSAPAVAFVAPVDPVHEHHWRPARIGQIRPGDKVRVMRDAFDSAELGRIHNGRVCEVLEVKDGDVICRSTDGRSPVLNGAHYAPYLLEEWSND